MLRHIPITDDGLLALDALDRLLTERTKLVAVTAVSNVLGTINPVAEIIRRAHAAGAVVLVDAAQSVPHQAIDVRPARRRLPGLQRPQDARARRASACSTASGELLDAMPPFLGGGSMIRRVRLDGFKPAELPASSRPARRRSSPAIGLGAAIDYLKRRRPGIHPRTNGG